jgi:predicted aspartyl protease
MNLTLVRRDLKKALAGDAIVDTGFDGSLYANIQLVEFLEGLRPIKTATLQALGHEVLCEVFKVECHLADDDLRPTLNLQEVEVYAPINVGDLSEDVIIGRAILNRLKLQLNGNFLQVLKL